MKEGRKLHMLLDFSIQNDMRSLLHKFIQQKEHIRKTNYSIPLPVFPYNNTYEHASVFARVIVHGQYFHRRCYWLFTI